MEKTQPTIQKTKNLVRTIRDDYNTFPLKDSISYAKYRLIVTTFNMILMEDMSSTGNVYKLPKGVGMFGIFKGNVPVNPVNYQHFKETGELIRLSNLHTDKYICRFRWLKTSQYRPHTANTMVSDMLHFRACRYFTRKLAQRLKTDIHINTFRNYNDY